MDYLKGAAFMYDKAMEIINKETGNNNLKIRVENQKKTLISYCQTQGFKL